MAGGVVGSEIQISTESGHVMVWRDQRLTLEWSSCSCCSGGCEKLRWRYLVLGGEWSVCEGKLDSLFLELEEKKIPIFLLFFFSLFPSYSSLLLNFY